jgi:predicted small lipoprotein YifL
MKPRAPLALLGALLAAAVAGCGQTGPLALPESARPIERATPTQPSETDDETDDERRNER